MKFNILFFFKLEQNKPITLLLVQFHEGEDLGGMLIG